MALFHSFLWLIFHCMYEPHLLYPFLCWWTVRWLPCLSYCKQCFSEHLSARIFSISLKSPEDIFFNTNAYSHLRQNESGSPRSTVWHLQFLDPPGDSCIDLLAMWIFFFTFLKLIIALQNFEVFCQTATRVSINIPMSPSFRTSLPYPSPSTLQSVTEPLFEFPESHSKFPLAIYFTYSNVNFYVTVSIHLAMWIWAL